MRIARRKSFAVLILASILASGMIAPTPLEGQQGVTYTLDASESFFTTGCQGPSLCLCPIFFGAPLDGSFRLIPLAPALGPIFEYLVEDFTVTKSENGTITQYVGTGFLTVDLIAQTQEMNLDLDVNGVFQQFESVGAVPLAGDVNDGLAIAVFHQVNACVFDGLTIVATATSEITFVRGDANQDGVINIGDPVRILSDLFGVTPSPACADANDANDDGGNNIADPVYLLAGLFAGGAPPPAPFPSCGIDPTPDALQCSAFSVCP